MDAIVALLLEKETVDGRDIERIVKGEPATEETASIDGTR